MTAPSTADTLRPRYDDLHALFINCTLKRSPDRSHTQGLIDRSQAIMEANGVTVDTLRAVDHDIATGVWPDMTEHGWPTDDWPRLYQQVLAADILVLAGPVWLGDRGEQAGSAYSSGPCLSRCGDLADGGERSLLGRPHHRGRRDDLPGHPRPGRVDDVDGTAGSQPAARQPWRGHADRERQAPDGARVGPGHAEPGTGFAVLRVVSAAAMAAFRVRRQVRDDRHAAHLPGSTCNAEVLVRAHLRQARRGREDPCRRPVRLPPGPA